MDQWVTLRTSLLLAMGITPLACGGSVQRGNQQDDGGSGGSGWTSAGSGTVASGGSATVGGASSVGGARSMGGASSVGGTGSGGATRTPLCSSPMLDMRTGLTRCAEGYVHRSHQVACRSYGGAGPDEPSGEGGDANTPAKPRAPADVPCGDFAQGGAASRDCSEFEHGFCRDVVVGPVCQSGCVVDDDCDPGFLCECGVAASPTGGLCVKAIDCQLDADCGPDSLCASVGFGCSSHGFACLSPADECRGDRDCAANFGYCSYTQGVGHRSCAAGVCGRPFLVRHDARVAPLARDAAWSANGAPPRVEQLTSAERAELAAHWARMGQLEHASIAAFARFSLQLLSLGAPPELVELCTQALADETAHARLCFSIASSYAARPVGPGPLDVQHSLELSSLADVVDLVIAEGCFGETLAALEAREAGDAAVDPVIADAYARIARDEQRHAELAFRFVRWALEQNGAIVRQRIDAALCAPDARSAAARNVVEPCLHALLALEPAA